MKDIDVNEIVDYRAFGALVVLTGLRPKEAAELRVGDVLENVLLLPKSKNAPNAVVLTPAVKTALRAHLDDLAQKGPISPKERLFRPHVFHVWRMYEGLSFRFSGLLDRESLVRHHDGSPHGGAAVSRSSAS